MFDKSRLLPLKQF